MKENNRKIYLRLTGMCQKQMCGKWLRHTRLLLCVWWLPWWVLPICHCCGRPKRQLRFLLSIRARSSRRTNGRKPFIPCFMESKFNFLPKPAYTEILWKLRNIPRMTQSPLNRQRPAKWTIRICSCFHLGS